MSKNSLRNEMPAVTTFIDQMRDAFGKDHIDQQIRRGIKGEQTFYAAENGKEIGTPITEGVCFDATNNLDT